MSRLFSYATPLVPSVLVVGFFVWFANWIPQIHWSPPKKVAIGTSATPAELAALGQTIVRERGCLACHTIEPGAGVKGGGRGPNLSGIAARRAQGVKGGPGTLVEYLVQSLYEPGAYLVEGYANIMPPSTGAPAKLSYEEIAAVVNYLQSLGGTPSVRIGAFPRPSGAVAAAAPTKASSTLEPKALLESQGCLACHSFEPGKQTVGPTLAAARLKESASARKMSVEAYLLEAIVDPGAYEPKGFPSGVMPRDYGNKLNAAQLRALVEFLSAGKSKP